jgi:transketolase
VVDVHTLKPFDVEGVCEHAQSCGVVLTLEEHNVIGGLGGAVAEACLEQGVRVDRFRRLGIGDVYPSVVGDQTWLRRHFGIDSAGVSAAVVESLAA